MAYQRKHKDRRIGIFTATGLTAYRNKHSARSHGASAHLLLRIHSPTQWFSWAVPSCREPLCRWKTTSTATQSPATIVCKMLVRHFLDTLFNNNFHNCNPTWACSIFHDFPWVALVFACVPWLCRAEVWPTLHPGKLTHECLHVFDVQALPQEVSDIFRWLFSRATWFVGFVGNKGFLEHKV